MATIVRLPKLGLSDRGEIVEWRVTPGDDVSEDDVIAILESDKSAVDIVATTDGVLLTTYVDEGEEIEIDPGRPIAAIGAAEETPPALDELEGDSGATAVATDAAQDANGSGAAPEPEATTDRKVSPKARKLAAEADVALEDISGTGPDGAVVSADVEAAIEARTSQATTVDSPTKTDVKATPKAKRLARSEGIDISTVRGTGPGGAVTAADVQDHTDTDSERTGQPTTAEPSASARDDDYTVSEVRELTRIEQTTAERLTRSAREKPHVRGNLTVNVERLKQVSDELTTKDADVSVNDLLFRAVVRTLQDHPEINAVYEDGEYRLVEEINVGYAVDTEQGLLVPVVRDAAEASLRELARARRDLVSRILDGEHSVSDLRGGTFTVTNVGALGLDSAFSIINPPQVAILVIGRRKPALFEGEDGIETAMGVTLSLLVDHRVLDGGDAGAFLTTLAEYVENPSLLF